MKSATTLLLSVLVVAMISSCVSKRKYLDASARIQSLRGDSTQFSKSISSLNVKLERTSRDLEKAEHKNAQLETDLQSAHAASTQTERLLSSKELTIEQQQQQMEALQGLLDRQRSGLERLRQTVMNALNQYKADELELHKEDGKLYVSMQDKLLFTSGSATVNKDGADALGKLAEVLNNSPEIQIMVEGHTDSIPISGRFADNWALSVSRATSIVRILTENYKVDPYRVIASGHSSYDPKDTNSTPEGRARNRRTEIILAPKLDELYELMALE